MARLSLKAAPTFKAKVAIPVAGGASVLVEMVFKHRTKSALDDFIQSRTDQADAASFMGMVEGWDLEDPFGPDTVEQLLENYIGAALATYRVYIDELIKAKLGN
jgi:hypothetical protein